MNRPITYGSRILAEKELLRERERHIKKCKDPKNVGIDNRPPPLRTHLVTRAKARMQMIERQQKIRKENEILLSRMEAIQRRQFNSAAPTYGPGTRVGSNHVPVLDCYLSPRDSSSLSRGSAMPKPSLNYEKRKQRAKEIEKENLRMLDKISAVKPHLNSKDLDRGHRESRYYLAMLSAKALGEPGTGAKARSKQPAFGQKYFTPELRQPSSLHSPRSGSSTARSPRNNSSTARSPRNGSSTAKSPRDGSSTARSPRNGSSTARTPRNGSSTARSPRNGSSTARSPRNGSSTARSPRNSSSTARSPRNGSSTPRSPQNNPRSRPTAATAAVATSMDESDQATRNTNQTVQPNSGTSSIHDQPNEEKQ